MQAIQGGWTSDITKTKRQLSIAQHTACRTAWTINSPRAIERQVKKQKLMSHES